VVTGIMKKLRRAATDDAPCVVPAWESKKIHQLQLSLGSSLPGVTQNLWIFSPEVRSHIERECVNIDLRNWPLK